MNAELVAQIIIWMVLLFSANLIVLIALTREVGWIKVRMKRMREELGLGGED